MRSPSTDQYQTLFFLASLGGGLAVAFSQAHVPGDHPDAVLVTYEHAAATWQATHWPIDGLILVGLPRLLAMGLRHFGLLA